MFASAFPYFEADAELGVYLKLHLCDMNDYTVEALVFSLDSIRALHKFVVLLALLCRREPLRETRDR